MKTSTQDDNRQGRKYKIPVSSRLARTKDNLVWVPTIFASPAEIGVFAHAERSFRIHFFFLDFITMKWDRFNMLPSSMIMPHLVTNRAFDTYLIGGPFLCKALEVVFTVELFLKTVLFFKVNVFFDLI